MKKERLEEIRKLVAGFEPQGEGEEAMKILTEEKLSAHHARYKAKNQELARRVAKTMEPFATALTDPKERRFFESLISGVRSWGGHVGTFGYTGVRCRRATICVDMDFVETAEHERKAP